MREQFRLHTQAVLGELRLERLPPYRKQLAPLIERPAFTEYTARATAAADVGASRATLAALESYLLIADGGARLTAAERLKLLFNVQSALVNLEDVDALVEAGAVKLLSSPPFLASESANVRKYAVSVLALLATSLKGQVAMLFGGAAASDAVAAADGGAMLDRVAAANADVGCGGGAMDAVAAAAPRRDAGGGGDGGVVPAQGVDPRDRRAGDRERRPPHRPRRPPPRAPK